MSCLKVGVLALQGAFLEHAEKLCEVGRTDQRFNGLTVVEVKRPEDLTGLSGIILPGGESTAMNRILDSTHNFRADLSRAVNDPNFAVWGTCAGLILMSEKLSPADPRVNPLGVLNITVERNVYGRQAHSFEGDISISEKLLSGRPSFVERTMFLRAPGIVEINDEDIEVVAEREGKVVGVKKGKKIGTSFHPELTPSCTWHQAFLEACVSDEL